MAPSATFIIFHLWSSPDRSLQKFFRFFFTKTHDPVANHPPSCEHLATSGCDSPVYRSQSRRQKNITRLMTMAAMTLG